MPQKCTIGIGIQLILILSTVSVDLFVKTQAATAETARLVGVVTDTSTKGPLASATIRLSGGSLTEDVEVTTDVSGKYEFGDVPVGTYHLTISFAGYTTFSQENVAILAGKVTTVNAAVHPEPITLEPVVVTASKYPQKISKAPAAVSVIERRRIEDTVVTTPADLLKGVPGVDFTSHGGGVYTINLRGFNIPLNNRMLVLTDGMEENDTMLGAVHWAALPILTEQIERIEVIKSPSSALYGANAYNGVINTITKSARELKGTTLSFGGGELNTYSTSLLHGGTAGNLGYVLALSYLQGDEWKRANPTDEIHQSEGVLELPKGNIRLEYDFPDQSRLTTALRYSSFQGTAVTGTGRVTLEGDRSTSVRADYRRDNLSIQAFWRHRDSGEIPNLSTGNIFYEDSNRYDLELQYRLNVIGRQRFFWGGNYRKLDLDTKGSLTEGRLEQNLFGTYLQSETKLINTLNLILAGRFDRHPQTGTTFSPKAALVYSPSRNHSLRLTVNRAFLNPTLLQLFMRIETPDGTLFLGKPDLRPEKTTSFEMGYSGLLGSRFQFSLDTYYNNVKDFFSPLAPLPKTQPPKFITGNFGKTTVKGIDLGLRYFLPKGVSLWSNYSFLDIKMTQEQLPPNAPENKWNVGLSFTRPGGFSADMRVRRVDTFEWASGVLVGTIEAYTLTDVNLGYRLRDDRIRISITGSNIFDNQHIELIRGAEIGRQILGKVAYKL